MAIHTTQWQPDTCGCIFEYQWDDTEPEDSRTHSLKTVVSTCPIHQNRPTNNDKFTNVVEENQRKNVSEGEIMANAPSTLFDLDADSGSRIWKKGISFTWQWTGEAPNRQLSITLQGAPTLTTQQKNAIQSKLNSKFGINSVILQ